MPDTLTITENGALFVAQHARKRRNKLQMGGRVKQTTTIQSPANPKISLFMSVLRWLERVSPPKVIVISEPACSREVQSSARS